jgi:hypothetical protein
MSISWGEVKSSRKGENFEGGLMRANFSLFQN